MKPRMIIKAFGVAAVAVVGVLIGGGTASADGHNAIDSDGTWGVADGAEQRGEDRLPAVQILDLSAPVVHNNYPVSTYPKAPENIPVGTYPILPPSWPGDGYGSVVG
jgi:hypothetical protein